MGNENGVDNVDDVADVVDYFENNAGIQDHPLFVDDAPDTRFHGETGVRVSRGYPWSLLSRAAPETYDDSNSNANPKNLADHSHEAVVGVFVDAAGNNHSVVPGTIVPGLNKDHF